MNLKDKMIISLFVGRLFTIPDSPAYIFLTL